MARAPQKTPQKAAGETPQEAPGEAPGKASGEARAGAAQEAQAPAPQPGAPAPRRPALTFPPEVGEWVRAHYAAADVILEYGSGGSTVLASEMEGKVLFSVESDAAWMAGVQAWLDHAGSRARIHLHHADIGPVGKWGRPLDESGWRRYHRYPLSVWDRPDFEPPDLVLIDGRFRPACFVTTMLRTKKPVTVLFDDYENRRRYRVVEEFFRPVEMRGRMARFEVTPKMLPREKMTRIMGLFTQPF